MKVYITSGYQELIEIKEAVKRTPMCVVFPPERMWPKGRRELIGNNAGQHIFFSWEDAHTAILERAERKVKIAESDLERLKAFLSRIRALVKPEEVKS